MVVSWEIGGSYAEKTKKNEEKKEKTVTEVDLRKTDDQIQQSTYKKWYMIL